MWDKSDNEWNSFFSANSWEDVSVFYKMVLFKAYDLDDGQSHWELGPLGSLAYKGMKLFGADKKKLIISFIDPLGSMFESLETSPLFSIFSPYSKILNLMFEKYF